MTSLVTLRATKAMATVMVVSAALTACGHKKKVAETPTPTPTPTVSVTPTPTPTPTPVANVNPLTGIGPAPTGPIVAVKIDDTDNGRPPVNLNLADIVYVEQVEGGVTRLIAVFGTNKPSVVEPVRSVRRNDPELMLQYGPKITIVASGGAPAVVDGVRRTGVTLLTEDSGIGYSRDYNRNMPYNLVVNVAQIAKALPGASRSRNVGFTWGDSDPRIAKSPQALTINATVGTTAVTWEYDRASRRYIRTEFGTPMRTAAGTRISAANVLVQFCDGYADPSDVDVVGSISHYTKTVGHGRVVLFRNGHRIEGRWSRATLKSPTKFVDNYGKPLLFQRGGMYVLLAATGTRV